MPSKSRPADPGALVSEEAIRERAYFLWEQAGRPDGAGDRFWHLALHEATQILVELSSSGVARATKGGKATRAKPKDAEAGKPKARAKAEAKPGKKASPKPRAAVQKPK